MSTLGEILDRLQERSDVVRLLAEAGDVAMIARLDRAAQLKQCDPSEVALDAVHAFAAKADGEAWVKLIGRVQDSETPAAACLDEMIVWALGHALPARAG